LIHALSAKEARLRYAEELRFAAKLRSRLLIDAFATVPRERFIGPGPWRVLSPMAMAEYRTTEDADRRHLYHDVLIAIDEERRLNNGQPSLWARMYDQLASSRGDHVVHVGAGIGITAPSSPKLSAPPDGSPRSRSTPSLPPEPRRISLPLGRKRRRQQRTVSYSIPTGRPTPSSSTPE
jgi:hypothetical protein